MNNLHVIRSTEQLSKILDLNLDKLVSVMFYTKGNPQCRTAKQIFEKIAGNNMISIFCVFDLDNLEGDDRMINNVNSLPQFDFYYMGKGIGSKQNVSDQKTITELVQTGQRYVMEQINLKNKQTHTQPQYNNQPQMVQQPVMQPQMVQQPMQPPTYYQPQQPQMNNIPQSHNDQQQMLQSMLGMDLPTIQQMNYFFQVFQMLNQLGVLNISAQPTIPTKINEEIVLSNGDKLIPLADGKYGWIKKT